MDWAAIQSRIQNTACAKEWTVQDAAKTIQDIPTRSAFHNTAASDDGCLVQVRNCFGFRRRDRRRSTSKKHSIDSFEELVKFLRDVPLFANDYPSDEIPHLAMALKERNYKPGDTIVSQGSFPDENTAFYVVFEGEVSLMWQRDRNGETTKEKRGTLHRGDYFGGLTLLENRAYTTSSVAGEPGATVYTITRQQFQTLGLHKLKFPARAIIYNRSHGGGALVRAGAQFGMLKSIDADDFSFVAKHLCQNVHIRALYNDEVIGRVSRRATKVEVPPGTVLYQEGDPVGEFYVIRSGTVTMRRSHDYRDESKAKDALMLKSVKRRLRKQEFLEKLTSLEESRLADIDRDSDDDTPRKSHRSLPAHQLQPFAQNFSPKSASSPRSFQGFARNHRSKSMNLEDIEIFRVGDAVVLQGDDPTRMRNIGKIVKVLPSGNFVVDFTLKGSSVHKSCHLRRAPTAGTKPALGEGAILGEMSLLYNLPRLATCTVSEASSVTLYAISRSDFEEVLLSTGSRNQNDNKIKEWAALLGEVRVLSSLVNAEIMELARMADGEMTFAPHERIIQKGKVRELRQWYVIAGGKAVLSRDESTTVATLGRGAHFGERSLLCGDGISEVNVDAGEGGLLCLCINGRILNNLTHCFDTSGTVEDYEQMKAASKSTKQQSRLNTDINNVRSISILGRGNFGVVSLAVDDNTQEQFALKRVSKRRVRQTRSQKHMRNERDLMSMVDSKYIIKLFGTYQDANYVYMLQEAALGGSLEGLNEQFHGQKLDAHARSWNAATQYFVGSVAMGLQHLHERHIVHRDLKLGNILLCSDGSPKICDFGFARFVLDKTYTVLGTPEYMAPEIIEFPHAHDNMVDYWALGVFTYEMLSGTVPWVDTGEEGQHLLYRIRQLQKAKPYPQIKGDVSAAATDFVHSLLNANPSRRLGKQGLNEIKNHKWFTHDFFDFDGLETGDTKLPPIPIGLFGADDLERVTPSFLSAVEGDDVFKYVEMEQWECQNIKAEDGIMSALSGQTYGFQQVAVATTVSSKICRITADWETSKCRGPVFVGLTSDPDDDLTFKNGCCICISPSGSSCPQTSSCYEVCSQHFDATPITLVIDSCDTSVSVFHGAKKVYTMGRIKNVFTDAEKVYAKVFLRGSSDSLEISAYEDYVDDESDWAKDFRMVGQPRRAHSLSSTASQGLPGKLYSMGKAAAGSAQSLVSQWTSEAISEAISEKEEPFAEKEESVEEPEPELVGRDVASLLGLLSSIEKNGGEADLRRALQAACVAVERDRAKPQQLLLTETDAPILYSGVKECIGEQATIIEEEELKAQESIIGKTLLLSDRSTQTVQRFELITTEVEQKVPALANERVRLSSKGDLSLGDIPQEAYVERVFSTDVKPAVPKLVLQDSTTRILSARADSCDFVERKCSAEVSVAVRRQAYLDAKPRSCTSPKASCTSPKAFSRSPHVGGASPIVPRQQSLPQPVPSLSGILTRSLRAPIGFSPPGTPVMDSRSVGTASFHFPSPDSSALATRKAPDGNGVPCQDGSSLVTLPKPYFVGPSAAPQIPRIACNRLAETMPSQPLTHRRFVTPPTSGSLIIH